MNHKNDTNKMPDRNGEKDVKRRSTPHASLFEWLFKNEDNVRMFLKKELPASVQRHLDLSKIVIEPTGYVSSRLRPFRSDIVVQIALKKKQGAYEYAEIYIIFEHKSSPETDVLVQVLNYMVLEWQKDLATDRPLKVIIPFIFYHGKRKWNIPRSFAGQFDVSDDLKAFMVDYTYMFFDTEDRNFFAEENQDLKQNVLLFTSLVLMKNAFNENMDVVREIARFWYEKGLVGKNDIISVFLEYIYETRDVSFEDLKKILDESKLDGGTLMPSLAQRLRDEGKEIWKKEGRKEGKKEGKQETAIQMLNDGEPIKKIIRYTGLTEKEIKDLMNSSSKR